MECLSRDNSKVWMHSIRASLVGLLRWSSQSSTSKCPKSSKPTFQRLTPSWSTSFNCTMMPKIIRFPQAKSEIQRGRLLGEWRTKPTRSAKRASCQSTRPTSCSTTSGTTRWIRGTPSSSARTSRSCPRVVAVPWVARWKPRSRFKWSTTWFCTTPLSSSVFGASIGTSSRRSSVSFSLAELLRNKSCEWRL